MRSPEPDELNKPVSDGSVDEKYIGETEKNLVVDLDTDPPVIIKPWWRRLLRR